jgi:3-deoxy-D-manno-octulosonic acid kinase
VVKLPPGYVSIRRGGATAFAHPAVQSWVETVLSRGTLHRAAAERAEETLRGRGPVYVLKVGGHRRVVRHYRRGGLPAHLLRDRFLRVGEPRPLRELRASERARQAGIPTPRVVAGAIYRNAWFYRADLVTDYVPESRTLADVVFGDVDRSDIHDALRAAGTLIGTMASIGLGHPDLNARNILLVRGRGGEDALPVDLDRCEVPKVPRAISPEPMVTRLVRSLRKIGGNQAVPSIPAPDDLMVLREAVGGRA